MLRDAALLELDILRTCLERGFILKDATPYNVQFLGCKPVHIDATSMEPWEEGSPWKAYTQFCQLFLNPLLLSATLGIPYHAWLRSNLNGIPPEDLVSLLPWHRRLRPGIWSDVTLQSWLNRKIRSDQETMVQAISSVRVQRHHLLKTQKRLRRTIERASPSLRASGWMTYDHDGSSSPQAREFKETFVDRVLSSARPAHVWDLGANVGRYSLIAARHSAYVVAIDADPQVVDTFYTRLRTSGPSHILCLVGDLLNPSPNQGWSGIERPGLTDRASPDFVLALALVHHLALAGNIPLPSIVQWLSDRAPRGIVEFVPKSDPQVIQMLRWREDEFENYSQEVFEAEVQKRYRRIERVSIPGTQRTLYAVAR
jgi:hypothetical protein